MWCYRASAVGRCVRALAVLRQGFEPKASPGSVFRQAVQEGHKVEAWYKARARAAGRIVAADQTQISLAVPGTSVQIVGHIDGIEYDTDFYGRKKAHILEVKSMSERRFKDWCKHHFDHFIRYQVQIAVYATAIHIPVKYVVINRDDKDGEGNYQQMDTLYMFPKPFDIEPIFAKVQQVELCASRRVLPECDTIDEYCPVGLLCNAIRRKFHGIRKS